MEIPFNCETFCVDERSTLNLESNKSFFSPTVKLLHFIKIWFLGRTAFCGLLFLVAGILPCLLKNRKLYFLPDFLELWNCRTCSHAPENIEYISSGHRKLVRDRLGSISSRIVKECYSNVLDCPRFLRAAACNLLLCSIKDSTINAFQFLFASQMCLFLVPCSVVQKSGDVIFAQ